MPASDTGLCRVCVHWGTAVADVALPAGIPVAVLVPSLVDLLEASRPDHEAERYLLSVPGGPALDPSTTLAQNDIRDGTVLVLSRRDAPSPAPRHFDVAQAVRVALDAATSWGGDDQDRRVVRLGAAAAAIVVTAAGGLALVHTTFGTRLGRDDTTTVTVSASAGCLALGLAVVSHRAYRDATAGLVLSVIATAFAAVAGFVAVPGAPGVGNVLLAAAAAGVTSTIAMRVSGCGVITLTAVSCCAVVIAVAGLVGVLSAAPLPAIASVAGLVSLGLLGMAARASIALAGLSPRPAAPRVVDAEPSGVSAKAIRADQWLASLLAGWSASAAVGAVVTVLAGAPRPSCTAFGVLTAALLLLRSRCADRRRMMVFMSSGIAIAATTFGVTVWDTPASGPWVAAVTATLAAAALYLGFVAPGKTVSPVARRSVEAMEWLALAAMVPLTCWICGLYGAARGLNLT